MSNKENSLIQKKKAQLVEIILRKDDEEIRLKKACEAAKKEVEEKNNTIKNLTDCLNDANAKVLEHQSVMDELVSQKVDAELIAKKFKKECNIARGLNCVLATAILIIIVLCIFL